MIGRHLLPQEVTIAAFEGTGAYGEVYAAPVTVPARVDGTRKLVRAKTGEEVVAETTVYLLPGTFCPPDSKITLPGDTVARQTLTYTEHIGHHGAELVEVTTK